MDQLTNVLISISIFLSGVTVASMYWRHKLDEYHDKHQMDLLKLRSDLIKLQLTTRDYNAHNI